MLEEGEGGTKTLASHKSIPSAIYFAGGAPTERNPGSNDFFILLSYTADRILYPAFRHEARPGNPDKAHHRRNNRSVSRPPGAATARLTTFPFRPLLLLFFPSCRLPHSLKFIISRTNIPGGATPW